LNSNEWALVNTDEARPMLRSRDSQGRDTNLWPRMKPGVRIDQPIPARVVPRGDVSVSGGAAQSSAWGTVPELREGQVEKLTREALESATTRQQAEREVHSQPR